MSPQGKRVVGLALILMVGVAPILYYFFIWMISLMAMEMFFPLSGLLLTLVLLNVLLVFMVYVTQDMIDKTALTLASQKFVRYFSLIGYLLVSFAGLFFILGGAQDTFLKNLLGSLIALPLIISYIILGIGFLRAREK